jgi:hypothetical protein
MHQHRTRPLRILETVTLWTVSSILTLIGAAALCLAGLALAVVLGPFYVIGGFAEWWRSGRKFSIERR